MSQVLTKVDLVETTVALVGSGHVVTELAPPDASTEQDDAAHLTPKQATQPLSENRLTNGEDEDDPLNYLVELFNLASLDDFEDSDHTTAHEPEGNESNPPIRQNSNESRAGLGSLKENPDYPDQNRRGGPASDEPANLEPASTTSALDEGCATPKFGPKRLSQSANNPIQKDGQGPPFLSPNQSDQDKGSRNILVQPQSEAEGTDVGRGGNNTERKEPSSRLEDIKTEGLKILNEDKVPPTPPSKGADDKYYFYTASGWYYYDDYHNLFFEDGTVYCGGSFDFESDDPLTPSFYLDGMPYRFDAEGRLLLQFTDGSSYHVQIWQKDQQLGQLNQDHRMGSLSSRNAGQVLTLPSDSSNPLHQLLTSPNDTPAAYPEPNPVMKCALGPVSPIGGSSPKPKAEVLSPEINPGSLQEGFQEGPTQLAWSPGSLGAKSPVVTSTLNNPHPPKYQSLFQATEPGYLQDPISTGRNDTAHSQIPGTSTQKVNKRGKEEDNRVNKVLRRPENLIAPSRRQISEKPHKCPFEGCSAGYVTKSNMKRHFLTHRAGSLEGYQRNVADQLGRPKTRRSSRAATISRRPSLLFRISQTRSATSLMDPEALLCPEEFPPSSSQGFAESRPGSGDPTQTKTDAKPMRFQSPVLEKIEIESEDDEPDVIGRHMSMQEMFDRLLHHGCVDLSSQMDSQQETAIIRNGGGFGDIWLGKLNNGTQVAIKAWRPYMIEQCKYKGLKRATREIYLWSRLKHPNIHQLMGVIMFKDQYLGMVSHWMENGNLHEYMRQNPRYDRYHMCFQIASGLAYMHQCSAVHGDLKACNVLVSSSGVPKLCDFGLCTMSEASLAFSETTNGQAGSMRWASPEHLFEGTPRSKPSDVYALGMTLLEIFTREVSYSQYTRDFQVMAKVQQGIFPTRPTELKDDRRGNRMWELLLSCWSREPETRPTAEQVLESLTAIPYPTRKRSTIGK